MGDSLVGVYYRPPDQDKEVDEVFYGRLEVVSWSQALVLLRHFNHPDIFWRDNMAQYTQSWKFLQITEDNFLMQVVEECPRVML